MKHYLVVVDMQNDFISMALGTPEAVEIVGRVREKIEAFSGEVIFTRDTHGEDYMATREGRFLPVPHCIKGSVGWQIEDSLSIEGALAVIDKPTFGSTELVALLVKENAIHGVASVTFVGLCTDICVISNAMAVKAALPEVDIFVDGACCAGVSPESHARALEAMKVCQIEVL